MPFSLCLYSQIENIMNIITFSILFVFANRKHHEYHRLVHSFLIQESKKSWTSFPFELFSGSEIENIMNIIAFYYFRIQKSKNIMNINAFFILLDIKKHGYYNCFHSFRNQKLKRSWNIEVWMPRNPKTDIIKWVTWFGGKEVSQRTKGAPHPPANIPCSVLLIRNPLLFVLLFWEWLLIQFLFKTDAKCSPGGPPPLVVVSSGNLI